jgi:YYY domain-containing protein
MIEVLRFWLVIQLFALAALPLAWRLFGALPSRGYALAKPLGLLLVTYVLWMGGSLGLLRNSAGGILASLALVAAASLWLGRTGLRRPAEALDRNSDASDTADRSPFTARLSSEPASQGHGSPLTAWLRANWRMILLTEVFFLAAMALWAFVRSYSPEITTAGGEKWMELTFLNGILRSERFPPLDPWLAGFAISYYYFGYVMLAALTQLSGLAPSVAFNVGLASWFALTMVAAFGVAYDMAAALLARTNLPAAAASQSTASRSPLPALGGLLGALFVALLGNLAAFLESMQGIGLGSLAFWRWLDIKDLNCLGGPGFTEPIANCPQAAGLLPERFYWWWRASRVLNDRDLAGNAMEVIDEFPFFSFLLGDMHPHVLGLPFVLLAVGLALAVVLGRGGKETSRQVDKAGSEDGVEAAVGTPITAPLSSEPASLGYRSPLTEILDAFPLRGAGFGLYALCLGGLAFLNTWDFPIYVFLVMLSLGAALAWRQGGLSWRVAGQAVLGAAALGVVGALLYLPFYIGFQSQAGGILPNFINPTRLPHFFVMFGPLLAAAIFLLIALSRGQQGLLRRWAGFSAAAIALPILFLGAALLLGLATPGGQALVARLQSLPMVQQAGIASLGQLAVEVGKIRLGSPWTYLLLAGMIGWVLALLMGMARRARSGDRPEQDAEAARSGDRPEQDAEAARSGDWEPSRRGQPQQTATPPIYRSTNLPAVIFALLILLTALLLTFSVEFVYLRDTFGTRMNTVFKFYFQAWVLLALVASFSVVYLARFAGRALRWGGLTVVTLLVVAGMFYPIFATYTRAERFQTTPTLDGTAYLARQNPADAAAVAWLQATVPGAATVLEAHGGSYTYAGRISAQTGLPTLLGWEGHELQWRGNTVEQDQRKPILERIYGSATGSELQGLLNRWQIDYVLVGEQERRAYGVTPQSEARLAQVMELVYDVDGVRIYRNRQAVAAR